VSLAERHWPHASPIGDHIIVGRDTLEPLRQMPAGQAQFVAARMYWVLRTEADPMTVADSARAEVRRLDKDVATSSTRPIRHILTAAVGSRRFNTDLIEIAGVASLLLAFLGVYSVTAFSMKRRTREIAIRLALGATPAQVIRPVLAGEWRAIAVGLIAGAGGAAVVSRVLSSTLYAGGGVEPTLIAAATAILASAAAIASYLPARRALRAEPVAALKDN
jgi:hypothetical protein